MPLVYSDLIRKEGFPGGNMMDIPGFILSTVVLVGETGGEKPGSVMILSSDAFRNGGEIPPVYTCKGQGISPKLRWNTVPQAAKSLALIVEDPDAPGGAFSHWVIYNIPPDKRDLPPSIPPSPALPDGTRQGSNDFRKTGYGPPCPPPGKPHRYNFRIFALDIILPSSGTMDRASLIRRMEGHIIAKADLMGFFKRG